MLELLPASSLSSAQFTLWVAGRLVYPASKPTQKNDCCCCCTAFTIKKEKEEEKENEDRKDRDWNEPEASLSLSRPLPFLSNRDVYQGSVKK